jgi:superfamily II DNA or RNA helicase
MGSFNLVVVDELQHSLSATYLRLLQWLGVFHSKGPRLIGLTATPERGDGQALSKVWERVVFVFSLPEAILRGYLADVYPIAVPLSVDLDAVAMRGDDFDPDALGEALMKTQIAEAVIEAYQQHAQNSKTIVFAPSVATSRQMAEAFQQQGIPAASVDGTMPKAARRRVLSAFHENDIKVCVNCQLLVEGYDEPDIETVIIARPTRVKSQYLQMLGRGTRRAPNKSMCRVIDFIGVTRNHSLISSPVLFGLKPEDVQQQTVTAAIKQVAQGSDNIVLQRLLKAASQQTEDLTFVPLHWIPSGNGWLVSAGAAGTVVMQPRGEGWHVSLINGSVTESLTPLPVWRELAIGIAEDVVRRASALTFADPNAPWRRKPATPKQVKVLTRWGIPLTHQMTAGEASDAITRAAAQRQRGHRA